MKRGGAWVRRRTLHGFGKVKSGLGIANVRCCLRMQNVLNENELGRGHRGRSEMYLDKQYKHRCFRYDSYRGLIWLLLSQPSLLDAIDRDLLETASLSRPTLL